ncbi:MAG: hypothetical protein HY665_05830 [Chloroflexi bacterium]|nr:hypothetical protein [Chloroflexota bacterium]
MVAVSRCLPAYLVSILLVLSFSVAGCAPPQDQTVPGASDNQGVNLAPKPEESQTPVYTVSSPPGRPVNVTLSVNGTPLVGQPVLATAIFALSERHENASNVTARIVLPKGFQLVSGELEWQGNMVRGTKYELKATIKAVKAGDWRIEARAFYMPNRTDVEGGTAYLWAVVYPDSATVSDQLPSAQGTPYTVPMGHPETVTVRLERAPRLGEPIKLRLIVRSREDVTQAEAFVELHRTDRGQKMKVPLADVLVEGELAWRGSLEKDVPVVLSATVRFPMEGDWEIRGYSRLGTESKAIPQQEILLSVGRDSGQIQHRQLNIRPSPKSPLSAVSPTKVAAIR